MSYTSEDLKRALDFARRAHKGQYDKAGEAYIWHPIAVAGKLNDPFEKIVALLHDVVEDTGYTLDDIKQEFGNEVAEVLDFLTRRKGEAFGDYIDRVLQNKTAVKVKLADMNHNMDLTRFSKPTQKDIDRVVKKYIPAYAKLSEAMLDADKT